jgi:hypothetical protein
VTGVNRGTVASLGLRVGRGCAELHDRMMVGLRDDWRSSMLAATASAHSALPLRGEWDSVDLLTVEHYQQIR